MSRLEELVQKLKQCGYKMTPQRRAILEALTEDSHHPTAEAIYEMVRKRLPDISPATIYNTLHELITIEEVCELDMGCRERHYEISRVDHAHRVCLRCGRIEDVPADLERIKSLFQCGDGFRPVRYVVTIYGYCVGNDTPSKTPQRR